MKQSILRLTIVIAILLLGLLAAVWYDEAPDVDMQRQWDSRPRVADENNLFIAMIGAGSVVEELPHVIGRRILESPSGENVESLMVPEGHRNFIDRMRTVCRAISMDSDFYCLIMHLPEKETQASEKRMAERYRALRRYTAYRSELRGDGKIAEWQLIKLHEAFTLIHLTVNNVPDDIPVEELVTDTRFLREALTLSDSLVARLVVTTALERNYRLVAECLEFGNAKQIAALKAALDPLPAQALDLSRDLPYEYATMRISHALYRQALIRGEDPLQEITGAFNLPSPFAGLSWQRRIKALWLKPEMTANASLSSARHQLGISDSRSDSLLRRALDASLNATGQKIRRFDDDGEGWAIYRHWLTDLDHYIRLIALVGTLDAQQGFDPVRVVADWNQKLSANAQEYRLNWDDKRSAFSFEPKSFRWKERAKTAGHGVLVRVPSYLVQDVAVWRGLSASCRGERCELLAKGSAPIVAKPGMKLPDDTKSFPMSQSLAIVREVKPAQYIGITYFEQNLAGHWFERRVRVRAANAN